MRRRGCWGEDEEDDEDEEDGCWGVVCVDYSGCRRVS